MHIPEDEAERRRLNERGREILRRKNGAVRPHREDGYVNLLNKYGTKQDNSEAYKFEREPVIPDMQLTGLYEGNGLFSKIIDTPAEEALKHGFDLNLKSDELNAFVEDAVGRSRMGGESRHRNQVGAALRRCSYRHADRRWARAGGAC